MTPREFLSEPVRFLYARIELLSLARVAATSEAASA